MVTIIPNDTENNFRAIARELVKLEEKINGLTKQITTLENSTDNRLTTIETYFTGVITNNTHYISTNSGTFTGKKLTITNGLITLIEP